MLPSTSKFRMTLVSFLKLMLVFHKVHRSVGLYSVLFVRRFIHIPLGAFENFRKGAISFLISVRPSVLPSV
jgi:hypothetical protein